MEKEPGGNVVLIGFMGSGKSTMGIRLSYQLRYVLEDTDKLIEARAGKTISEIFVQEGEEAFRQMETELLEKLAERKGQRVYSAGGGTPVRAVNRPLLKKLGTVVYLRTRPETIYERLKDDTTRPLLQGEDPLGTIRRLMAEREEAYIETADMVLDVDDMTVDQVVARIVKCVR
ncbi:MAG: shikimate kinase [Acetatifactor sp.]|nr:shikimate kinase [Acetatifactor sp.]